MAEVAIAGNYVQVDTSADSLASHHHRVGMATDPRPPEADVGVCDEEAAKATGGRGTSGGLSDLREWPQRESGRES